MIQLSASQLDLWLHSERCWWWKYIARLSPKGTNENLLWGSMVHRILETLYQGHSVTDAVDSLSTQDVLALEQLTAAGSWRSLSRLELFAKSAERMVQEDHKRFEFLVTEGMTQSFEVVPGIQWRGVIDLVVRDRIDGRIYIIDHKTTEKKVDSSYYSARFSHDTQMTSYNAMGQAMYGEEFGGVQINAFQFTKTIELNPARFPIVRDEWQTEEWVDTVSIFGPRIANARVVGTRLHAEGFGPGDRAVDEVFPHRPTYSENFCDFRNLNRCVRDFRDATAAADFEVVPLRTEGTGRSDDVDEA